MIWTSNRQISRGKISNQERIWLRCTKNYVLVCHSLLSVKILWSFPAILFHLWLDVCVCFRLGISAYPIVSIEDPFDKEDWEHIKYFSSRGLCQVCFLHFLICWICQNFLDFYFSSCMSGGILRDGGLQVVGDDLLMSNAKRIERAINESTCNALLLKVSLLSFWMKCFLAA